MAGDKRGLEMPLEPQVFYLVIFLLLHFVNRDSQAPRIPIYCYTCFFFTLDNYNDLLNLLID